MSSNFSRISTNKEKTALNILNENFNNFKNDEPTILFNKNHSSSFIEIRKNMLNWVIFLCQKLHFKTQTLFRSVTIFDLYMANKDENYSQNELNLITIACLSLSTKIEEINCNYISFFNEKVLNPPNEHIYNNIDLTKMEFKILKELNYKIIYSTPFDFLEIYTEIFKNILNQNKNELNKLKNEEEEIYKKININNRKNIDYEENLRILKLKLKYLNKQYETIAPNK